MAVRKKYPESLEAKEVILEYDYCDIVLDRIRHLNSEEKEQMRLWFGEQLDAIGMRQPHAIRYSDDLESKILKGVFDGWWENIEEAKRFASELLRYVRKYKPVPIVSHRVTKPPMYVIAKMKEIGYFDDEHIIKEAKTLGLEETKVREFLKNYDPKSFDWKTFCGELKRMQKKS